MRLIPLLLALLACTPALADTPLPAFDLQVMNGEPGQMYSSENSKPMLIEFYFNGCSACNANADSVKEISDAFNNEKSNVIEFSYDCAQSDYDSWIRRHAPTAFVLRGCNSDLFDILDVQSFPTTMIFDAQHNSVYRLIGTWDSRDLQRIRQIMLGFQ